MKTRILFLAALIVLATGVKAQPATRDFRPHKGMNVMRQDSAFKGRMWANPERQHRMNQPGFVQALNLSDDQIKAIKYLRLQMHKEVKPLQNKLMEAVVHQKTLLSADEPNMKAINENIEKIGAIRIDIQKTRTKYLLDMRSKLNDEQRMKLDMMKSHHGNFNGPRKGMNSKGMNNGQMRQGFDRMGMGMDFGPGFDF